MAKTCSLYEPDQMLLLGCWCAGAMSAMSARQLFRENRPRTAMMEGRENSGGRLSGAIDGESRK